MYFPIMVVRQGFWKITESTNEPNLVGQHVEIYVNDFKTGTVVFPDASIGSLNLEKAVMTKSAVDDRVLDRGSSKGGYYLEVAIQERGRAATRGPRSRERKR